jgi:outer membrane protein insertion porin family
MKQLLVFVIFGVCFLFAVGTSAAQDSFEVDKVNLVGTQRIDEDAVRISLTAKPGPVTRITIRRDIRSLYKTGFFEQVEARIDEEEGTSILVYQVIEKPVVRKIFIKGNDAVSESDLAEVLKFDERRHVDQTAIERVMRQAAVYYKAQGYYDAELEYSTVLIGQNEVDITFTVVEGERYAIEEVRFRGLEEIDEDDLEDVIQTAEYTWYSSWITGSGRLNEEMLQNDKILIRQYLIDNGYIDGVVREPVVEKKEDGLYVTFDIQEGDQYRYGDVSATGDLIEESVEKTIEGVSAESGEVFSGSELREDSLVVSEKFGDIGYAFANVVPNTRVDPDSKTVGITYDVTQGELVHVDRIKISGNNKTYDKVIRRELKLQEQETYSSSKMKRSQALLERLGYFEEVNITTEPGQEPDEVNLLVNVREGSTGSFSIGAGFSSSDGALFNARLSENNFLGTGRRISLNADVGSERENFVVSLQDRRLNDTYWSGGFNLLKTEREFSDFDRSLAGGGVSVGYPLEEAFEGAWAEDINFSLRYEYLDIDISEVDDDAADLIKNSEGKSSSSGFTPSLVRNTINNPLNPVSGSRQEISFEITGFGGNEEYYLFELENSLYYPLFDTGWGPFVFSMRNNFGYGETLDDDEFPLFRRYFPGGINSVRGYEARTLGPKDENGSEFGGSKQLVNNLEIIFPIISSAGLKGVVFYDIGEAFDDDESIEFGELREAYGYGIRWISPLGPIRLEFGFPIDREEGEDSMVTQFSFGAPL